MQQKTLPPSVHHQLKPSAVSIQLSSFMEACEHITHIPDAIDRADRLKASHNRLRERIDAVRRDFAKLRKAAARLERAQAMAQHVVRVGQMSMEPHMSRRELAELGSRMSNKEENAELLRVVHDRKVQSLVEKINVPVQGRQKPVYVQKTCLRVTF